MHLIQNPRNTVDISENREPEQKKEGSYFFKKENPGKKSP